MSRIPPETWTRLAVAPPLGERLVARSALPEVSDRLLAAIDAEGRRHLLVALVPAEDGAHDVKSRGVSVETMEMKVAGDEPRRYINISCQDVAGHDAFDLIGGEIADQLASGRGSPAEHVARVLAKWRRFWGQAPKQLLTREQLIGLFSELWFLRTWMLPTIPASEAVARWRGPFGARHDFEWKGCSVEAKGTTSTRATLHLIHGVEQLVPPQDGVLFVFSLRLREEAGASNTLPLLIDGCREQLAADPDALGGLETALVVAGYSAHHEDEYGKLRVRVVHERLFEVREGFPRITPSSFVVGVPVGVEDITYMVNLDSFPNLCVAHQAAEAALLLQ